MQDGVTFRQRPQLFLNEGAGRFREYPPVGVWAKPLLGRGAAYADYDRDGDVDVLLIENGGPVHLWRNRTDPGRPGAPHFVQLALRGVQSNWDALGTQLIFYAGGRRLERRVHGGSSYLSQPEYIVTVGLGPHTQVDSLVVWWPSGLQQRFEQLAADHRWLLIEGQPPQPYRPAIP